MKETATLKKNYKKRSTMAEVWRNLKKNKGAMLGLVIVLVLVFAALFADVIYDYDTDIIEQHMELRLQGPSAEHICGTDELGRDIFARLVYGTRYSLSVGVLAVIVALLLGVTLGSIAGYVGGTVENVIMRITDMFSSIPSILMATAIVAALGASLFNLMLAIGVSSTPAFVRVSRAAVLSERNREYVESARAIGMPDWKIVILHVLPNSISPIIVQATLRVASAIVSASGLSFLGLGIPAPAPEWGSILSMGRSYIRDYSYMSLFPGLAIMITVLSLNLLGDGLRDAIDPKLKT